MGALASRFHEYKATGMLDGTLSGFWNFALEPMLDHLEAWDAKDIDKARQIWDGGLVQLHEYVADMGRLHIRYKTASWLRGLFPIRSCARQCQSQSKRKSMHCTGC